MFAFIEVFLGLSLLVTGASFLVRGSKSLALKFGVSELIIGLTILAFGTSIPELIVSLVANSSGSPDLTLGNIIGSNIANILLIVGATAIVAPISVKHSIVWNEIPFSFLGIIILAILSSDILLTTATQRSISRVDGLILLSFFVLYLFHLYTATKNSNIKKHTPTTKENNSNKLYLYIFIGVILLFGGGQLSVQGAESIAVSLGLSETVIGLTVLAIGTSLPELITTLLAVYKKEKNLAIGNIIGSNIFNIFWILGLSSTISPIAVHSNVSFDILVLLMASLLMYLFLFTGKTKKHIIDKYEGVILLIFFFSYLIFNLVRL